MKPKWNEKLKKYAGKYISCDKFEKNGLETEGYLVNPNGTLGFRNELKSLNAATVIYTGQDKSYWNNSQKEAFLKALQAK